MNTTEQLLGMTTQDWDEELTSRSPSVQDSRALREQEEADRRDQEAQAARDAYRGTTVEQMGPSDEDYDYVGAHAAGVDFASGNLPNAHIRPRRVDVQGVDIATGQRVYSRAPAPNPQGQELELDATSRLQQGVRNADGTAPATDMPALIRYAMAAQMQGVESFEQWQSLLGPTGHDRPTLTNAWVAAERVHVKRSMQEYLETLQEEGTGFDEAEAEMLAELDEEPDVPRETLPQMPEWTNAARVLYKAETGEDFEGDDASLSDYALRRMIQFRANTGMMALLGAEAATGGAEVAEALLSLDETFERVPLDPEIFGGYVAGVVTDPLTFIGLGVGKLFLSGVAHRAMRTSLRRLVTEGALAAGIEGAGLGAMEETVRQGAEVEAGRREERDWGEVGVQAGVGAGIGVVAGGALGAAGSDEVIAGGRALLNKARQNLEATRSPAPGSPRAQWGKIGKDVAQPPSNEARPSERSAHTRVQEAMQPANPHPGTVNAEHVPAERLNQFTNRTGIGTLPMEDVTWNGKGPSEWTPDEWTEFGDAHGVPNLGGLRDDVDVEGFAIPGGLEGKFSYVEMMALKAKGHNPRKMSKNLRAELVKKFARTLTPDPNDHVEIFNRYVFGLLSPNQPLTANMVEYSRVRAQDMQSIEEWAKLIPWKAGDKVSQQTRTDVNKALAKKMGTQAASAGGLGLKGTADYTAIAELAQMMLKDPKFFTKQPGESWHHFVEKVMTQTQGLSAKVASFSTVWQDPFYAEISAVDRHMGRLFKDQIMNTPEVRLDFETKTVEGWNESIAGAPKKIAKAQEKLAKEQSKKRPVRKRVKELLTQIDTQRGYLKREPVENFDDLANRTGGSTYKAERFMSYITATSDPLFIAYGKPNPSIPEHLRNVDWVVTPERAQLMSDVYRRALAANDAAARQQGLHLFMSQWMLWDEIRGRLEPHEFMFPGLYRLPKMSQAQAAQAMQEGKEAGIYGHPYEMTGVDELTGEATERMVPLEEMKKWKERGGMDWRKGAMFSILPMVGATSMSERDDDSGT